MDDRRERYGREGTGCVARRAREMDAVGIGDGSGLAQRCPRLWERTGADETQLGSPVECGFVFHPFVQRHNRNVSAQRVEGQKSVRMRSRSEKQERVTVTSVGVGKDKD